MNTDLVDAWRVVVMSGALWLALLITRLGWRRYNAPNKDIYYDRPHWMVYVSYAFTLYSIVILRAIHFGEPVDLALILSTIIVVTGLIGIHFRVKFHTPFVQRRR